MTYRTDLITGLIRDVPDFPEPGVTFKDITPLLANANGYAAAISELVDTAPRGVDVVLGMEARGFMFAGPVALSLGAGFIPVRKPGKLPGDVYSQSFVLEYGSATLTVHQDAIKPGSRVMIVDDVMATGGTAVATANLLKQLGVELVHVSVLMELSFLHGRDALTDSGIDSFSSVLTV